MSILKSTKSGALGVRVTEEMLLQKGFVKSDIGVPNIFYYKHLNSHIFIRPIINPTNGNVEYTYDGLTIDNPLKLAALIKYFEAKSVNEKQKAKRKFKEMCGKKAVIRSSTDIIPHTKQYTIDQNVVFDKANNVYRKIKPKRWNKPF